jgi:NAD(P)-dependent dehydrogenase (short-subunit alcohol dehydrogenase family)
MPSALVTGASRGIGLAITRHLSERGSDLHATTRSTDDLRDLAYVRHVQAIALDITDRAARLHEQPPSQLDGGVNNAGIIVQGPVESVPLEDLSQQLEVNVTAQTAVVQAVPPQLREARGRVVFMSSVSGSITLRSTGAYSASKYALESLADALRMEVRPRSIPVSLIEPGPTRTDMWGDALDDYDQMSSQLSSAHRQLYASHLADNRRLLGRMQKLAGDPQKAVRAADRSLTARRPKRRYRCANVSRAQLALVSTTPTGVTDALFAGAATS